MGKVLIAATLLMSLIGVAGCGGSETSAAETVVVTQTVAEDGSDGSATDDAAPILPDLIGERLDVAESELEDLGIEYEEVGGGTFGVVVTSNWTVCDQRPAAGEAATNVKLIVARPGECDSTTRKESTGGSADGIPDLVGQRLDIAESELDDLGIAYEEVGGGTFGVINTSAWEVCETRPGAGEAAQVVKLIVARPGDC